MSSFVNLLLQFGLMATLVVAVLYAKRVRFGIHGTVMSAVVALNLLSILLVMLPSAVRILSSSAPVEL